MNIRRRQLLRPIWAHNDKSAGIYANHGRSCSCCICGNPRKHFGKKTLKEKKFDQDYLLG